MSKIIGLGPFCSANPLCKRNDPCSHCLSIGSTERDFSLFTLEELDRIEKFMEENKDLMDDLAKGDN